MKIAYFGSPEISKDLLEKIRDYHAVELILTQPDKPAGKRLEMTPTSVKKYAQVVKIEYFDQNLRNEENKNAVVKLLKERDIDLCIVFAYGQIIDQELLSIPKYGFWNIHPSLLPKYRGPSPLVYPLILGEDNTGVTLMQMDIELDQGNIIDQEIIPIELTSAKEEITSQVIQKSAKMIKLNLNLLERTKQQLKSTPQNHDRATYTRLLTKQDGYIHLDTLKLAIQSPTSKPKTNISDLIHSYNKRFNLVYKVDLSLAKTIWNLYRGLSGWPGLWTKIPLPNGYMRLKIIEAKYNNGIFIPKIVQIESKNAVNFSILNKSYNIFYRILMRKNSSIKAMFFILSIGVYF